MDENANKDIGADETQQRAGAGGTIAVLIVLIILAAAGAAIAVYLSRKPETAGEGKPGARKPATDQASLILHAQERLRQGDNGGGVEAFGRAAKIDPKSPELIDALVSAGTSNIGGSNIRNIWAAAILDSDVAGRVASRILSKLSPEASQERAALLRSSAYRALERALEINSGWTHENAAFQTSLELARIAHEQENYDRELLHLESVWAQFGNSSRYHFAIGFAKMKLKEYMPAINSFRRAVSLDSDWGNASAARSLTNMGASYYHLGQYPAACDTLRLALEDEPMNRIAAIYWRAANNRLENRRYFPPIRKAWKHLRAGRVEDAAAQFNRAASLLPGDGELVAGQLAAAVVYRTTDDERAKVLIEKGSANFQTAQEMAGRLTRAGIRLADEASRRQYLERASLAYDFAVGNVGNGSGTARAELLGEASEAKRLLGRFDEALVLLREVVPHFENASFMHAKIGSVALEAGNVSEAVGHLERAIEIDKEWRGLAVEKCFLELGESYEKLRRFIDARSIYGKAFERFPGSDEAQRGWKHANEALPPGDRIPEKEFFGKSMREK